MDREEFLRCIAELLEVPDSEATEKWLQYAEELNQAGTESKGNFFDEMCGELHLIKGQYGLDIAQQLYRCGRTFTFAPFELRTAAEHLEAGVSIEKVVQMALDGDFYTTPERYHKTAAHRPKNEMSPSKKGAKSSHER